MTAYDASERAAILAGDFFTPAELRARPWLGRTVLADAARNLPGHAADPNTRPMTARDRAAVEAMTQVCAYCSEPADVRSAIGDDGMHPECSAAWDAARQARS
jgi:hypothetical protein